jgi:hypothetical protein
MSCKQPEQMQGGISDSMHSCKTQPLTWDNHQVRIERKIEKSDETVSKHI